MPAGKARQENKDDSETMFLIFVVDKTKSSTGDTAA